MAWVTIDGEYGGGLHLTFEANQLTDVQWENLENMADVDRYYYVEAILDGNEEVVEEIESNNFG